MPINWQDGAGGGTPLSAANLNRLAVIADVGTPGTPTGDAVKAAATQATDGTVASQLASGTQTQAALKAALGSVVTPESRGAPAVYAAGHDDTAAVQAAVTDAIATGATLVLSRVYGITAPVTGSGRLVARGAGAHDNAGNLITGLLLKADAVDGLKLTGANGSILRDFGIKSAITTPTGGAGLRFTGTGGGDFARLTDLAILNCYDGLAVDDGTYYKIRGVDVFDPVRYGMHFAASAGERFDHGDQTVSGCTISTMFVAGRSGGTAVRWESGGGLRFTDNKINGLEQPSQGSAGRFQNGLDLAVGDGATSVLLVTGNSIENCTGTAIQVRQGGFLTGSFSKITITGNELNNSTTGVALSSTQPADTANNVGLAVISSNIFTYLTNSITLTDVYGVHIGTNVHTALSGAAVTLSGTNGDVRMDAQNVLNANKVVWSSTDAAGDHDKHLYNQSRFVLEREVPTTTSTTAYTSLYRLSVAPYSAGIIDITLGGNVPSVGSYSYRATYTYGREANGTIVNLVAVGSPITAGAGVDVHLDANTTLGDVIVGVKLSSGSGGTDVCGAAVVTVIGPLSQIVKGS